MQNANNNNNGNNNGNNGNIANGNNDDDNINIINNNNYNPDPEQELMNNVQVLPIAMRANMLRMLYELRVPLYALGALAGRGGDEYVDDIDQAAAAVLARSLYDARPVKHVIDDADDINGEKHGIREITYDPETAEELKINTACGIWQEEFEKGEAVKVLPCNHAFRAEAITKWLTTEKAECPMCRFKLESKEVIVHPDAGGDGDDNVRGHVYEINEPQHPQAHPHPHPEIDEQRARENNIMYRQNNIIYNRAHGGGAADMGRDVYYGMSMPMNQLIQMRGRLVNGGSAAAAMPSSHPIQPSHRSQHPPAVTNINNYYINQQINQYQISAEEQEQADVEEAIRRSLE
jgi:hypothetical protein